MDADFWLQKWDKNEIAFHNAEVNPLLVQHIHALKLAPGARIFLPLCGKTRDIAWLLGQGYQVVGAELSELAVKQLFDELGVVPNIAPLGSLQHYSQTGIDIFMGDIFALTSSMLGKVDAVYDRAALVALPAPMRERYSAHLTALTHQAKQLLICYEYDQNLQAGPPFSVTQAEVTQHYAGAYDLHLLQSSELAGGLKGKCAATEKVWLLTSRSK
ncbi:thiopurine S-methyltransferase [Ampullimonas aquatilis]|uniref:thiopurine S-methyltransferase n=1 Tax=Ampullimonas aquatilis TaxID=1341549 RepID=UPI003C77ADC9